MGHCGNVMLGLFRGIQLLLSLITLGCGAYITYKMLSIAETAEDLETMIKELQGDSGMLNSVLDGLDMAVDSVKEYLDILADVFNPVLEYLQSTPVRAIVVSFVGLWSLIIITYLFFAQRSKNHPRTNKRSVRVTLELVTLLLWIACIACATMLAVQYGILILAGGGPVKLAFKACKELIKAALKKAIKNLKSGEKILEGFDIFGDLVTIGGLSIISAGASVVCTMVSFMSLIVACCMSGKSKSGYEHGQPMSAATEPLRHGYVEKTPVTYIADASSPWQSPVTPATPYQYSDTGYVGRQMV